MVTPLSSQQGFRTRIPNWDSQPGVQIKIPKENSKPGFPIGIPKQASKPCSNQQKYAAQKTHREARYTAEDSGYFAIVEEAAGKPG